MRLGITLVLTLIGAVHSAAGATVLFAEPFAGKLAEGWIILREDPAAWRVEDGALRVRVQPGNMWGPSNNARNVFTRPLPAVEGALSVAATLENAPSAQYEQVDLVWYYDDSHMVKIGIELVHGQLSVVMGREEGDKARTINIIPIVETSLRFRFTVEKGQIRGEFKSDKSQWRLAGECELPAHAGPAFASLQCYQGSADAEHWAKISHFEVTTGKD